MAGDLADDHPAPRRLRVAEDPGRDRRHGHAREPALLGPRERGGSLRLVRLVSIDDETAQHFLAALW
jgi:hypothetical protein